MSYSTKTWLANLSYPLSSSIVLHHINRVPFAMWFYTIQNIYLCIRDSKIIFNTFYQSFMHDRWKKSVMTAVLSSIYLFFSTAPTTIWNNFSVSSFEYNQNVQVYAVLKTGERIKDLQDKETCVVSSHTCVIEGTRLFWTKWNRSLRNATDIHTCIYPVSWQSDCYEKCQVHRSSQKNTK